MKNQKQATIIFFLIVSIFFMYMTPLVFAYSESGFPGNSGLGDPSDNQQQGAGNNTNQMGGPEGNQTRNQNQGELGYGNGNNTAENQYRYRYQTRYMNIDGKGNCTRIRSQYRNNNTEEPFEIFFNIDNAPTLQLSYNTTSNASTNLKLFSLIIDKLIEYNDINVNGKYDRNDAIVSTLMMSNVTFTNITYTNNTTQEGKTITILETHTLDDIFSIVIYLASEQTSFFNNIITPEEVKIDFHIVDYPFVNQTSRLALLTHIETPFIITTEQNTYDEKKGIATQESGLNISSTNHQGFFSWANNAIIDNTSYPVNVTVLSETEQTFTGITQETVTQTQVIFSYPRGEIISHDPKIGVIDILQNIVSVIMQFEYLSSIYVITCVISTIVFIGVIRYRKRQ